MAWTPTTAASKKATRLIIIVTLSRQKIKWKGHLPLYPVEKDQICQKWKNKHQMKLKTWEYVVIRAQNMQVNIGAKYFYLQLIMIYFDKKTKWIIIQILFFTDTTYFSKIKEKYCSAHYKEEDTLQGAIETCMSDEICQMFYSFSCNDQGPFRLCQSKSDLQNSNSTSCSYLKKDGK